MKPNGLPRSSAPSQPALIAALVLACSIFAGGCDTKEPETPAATQPVPEAAARPQAPEEEELTIAPEEVLKPWLGDLDGMIERGFIRLLTAYSKTFYFVDKATQRGLIYDFARVWEEDLNERLVTEGRLKGKHLKVKVVVIPVARDELLPALVAGRGDLVAANLTITEERRKLVDFATPFGRNISEVLVSGPASPAVSSVDELAGKTAVVRKSSSYYESLMALNGRLAAEGKPAVVLKEAPEALEDEDLIEMLNAGLIPLTVVDKLKADFWKQVFPGITVHDDVVLRAGGEHASAVRKGSPRLKAYVADFAARNAKGSLTANVLLAQYLKSMKYLKDAASEAERRKFLDLVQYFQKYGDSYDVDWLLMLAQGYQESGLDQSVRSQVGAIGVMQVMPATGKDLDVGDIAQLEPNIHAGIKYMRWMIDQYYGNEPMTKLDKALVAFASYNAGPGRVSQLRKEAARRGLSPNVWFQNVEYVAAEEIGAETVTYVGNIYKYCIAYQLLVEARVEREKAAEKMKGQTG